MIRRLIKLLTPVLTVFVKWYLSKPRGYRYRQIAVIVKPGVFYPGFFNSTRILLDYVCGIELNGKQFHEPGAGCGIISVLAARKGAIVTATDINPVAIQNIRENALLNNVNFSIIQSDLLTCVPLVKFDYVVINPPYYAKDPVDFSEMAWFCGADFDYYRKLFPQLKEIFHREMMILMILSQDCDINKIKEIAGLSDFKMTLEKKIKRFGEWNEILRIERISSQVERSLHPSIRTVANPNPNQPVYSSGHRYK